MCIRDRTYSSHISKESQELSILFLRCKRVDYHGIHDYHRYFNTHPAFTTGSIHCCILYRIVSSPNYNWYPIYMVLVEKQASTSLISHSVYRDFHDGCYFSLARWQRNLPKRNDSITNHSFKSHVSRNLQATIQVDTTSRVNRRKSYHATLRFPHRAD